MISFGLDDKTLKQFQQLYKSKSRSFTDTYWDNPNYQLIKNNVWLRSREDDRKFLWSLFDENQITQKAKIDEELQKIISKEQDHKSFNVKYDLFPIIRMRTARITFKTGNLFYLHVDCITLSKNKYILRGNYSQKEYFGFFNYFKVILPCTDVKLEYLSFRNKEIYELIENKQFYNNSIYFENPPITIPKEIYDGDEGVGEI